MTAASPRGGVVIVAAGASTRMGGLDKVSASLAGKSVLAWSLQTCEHCDAVHDVVVVTRPASRDWVAGQVQQLPATKVTAIVLGGPRRQDSVLAGVQALTGCDIVAVHDAARPFAPPALFARVLAAAYAGCAIAASPLRDTIKRVEGGKVTATISREDLWAAQTPQAAPRDVLLSAFQLALRSDATVTDEAQLCELAGIPVTPVESLTPNFKLTTPEDVQLAEALAQQLVNLTALAMPPALPFAIGTGYDIHRLVPGRPLVLGGVTFASEVGLDGHSDADVLLHALMDALLGALALGDIGKHFPPSDQRYRGADSRDLLRQVRALLASHGATPINVDATVVAEHPRLAAVVEQMRVNIAADLAIAVDCVSIKATTNEGLGPEGRREGISATAVALVAKQARA